MKLEITEDGSLLVEAFEHWDNIGWPEDKGQPGRRARSEGGVT